MSRRFSSHPKRRLLSSLPLQRRLDQALISKSSPDRPRGPLPATMANNGLSASDRWARTIAEEIRRFRSLKPRRGRVLRFTPMPPEVKAQVDKELGVWPLPQSKRDGIVDVVAKKMAGSFFALRYGAIPEPEASSAAAALEAEAFAAASAHAADKDLATDAERCQVFKMYVKDLWSRAHRYAKFRPLAAAGTSRAGPAALPPPAASVAVLSGPVQRLALPSASAPPQGRSQPLRSQLGSASDIIVLDED